MTVRAPAVCLLLVLLFAVGGAPAAAQQLPPPEASPEEFRETADEVLSRQEFQRPEPTVLERARDWLGDRLDEIVTELTGGGAGSVVGWVVLALAAVALIWSLTRLGRTVRGDPTATPEIRIDQGRAPDEWRDEADRSETEGDWKTALLFRYRALLGDLVRMGVVDDVPGRTTGEYRREVDAARPSAAAPFAEATGLFELAWYADRPTGPEESARFRAAAGATVEGAGVPRPAAGATSVGAV